MFNTLFLSLFIFLSNFSTQNEEITLFNANGKPTAYIATDDMTVYMWNGKPVAYLTNNNGSFNIYGFNGKHLGWFTNGLIKDHEGYTVGFIKGAVNTITEFEPYKSNKQIRPYQKFKEIAPNLGYQSSSFAKTPLSLFLAQGVDD